jgi:hypothetical protein
VPVANELVGANVQAHTCLAREEEQNQDSEKQHVGRESRKYEKSYAVQQRARPLPLMV